MTDFHTLELIRDPRGFATLWLDRPDRHNALDAQLIAELGTVLAEIASDQELRFLLLRGRGRHFCAGADLAWMQASANLDAAANRADSERLAEVMYRLQALPLPTLAVVQGAAFGGAVGLVSCCDLALAASDATFCLSEVRIGLVPAVIAPFVIRALGERAARRYMLGAERFSGERAAELGLVAETAPAADLEPLVEAWIARLLDNGPQALRACKRLLEGAGEGAPSAEVRQFTEGLIAAVRVTPEAQEGLAAFLEKRRPAWQETSP